MIHPRRLMLAGIALLLGPAGGLSAGSAGDRPALVSAASGEISASAHDGDAGRYFVRNFSAREYGAHVQNWSIDQHPDGRIFVANNEGVLEFDGVRWRRIPVRGDAPVRSLAIDDDGRIYVGAQGEVGYIQEGGDGHMAYHSLMPDMPENYRDFSHVWRTFVVDDVVYFAAVSRLLRWDGEQFHMWEPQHLFHFSFLVGDRLYILERDKGLMQLKDDKLRLVPGGERFADDLIYAMLPWQESNQILLFSRSHGFLVFDGNEFFRWETEADKALLRELVYHAIPMPDGGIAVGTLQAGIYFLDERGRWTGHVSRESGLQDSSVLYLSLDHESGLWVGLARGMARLETGHGVTYFDETHGLSGSVYVLTRHKGDLYAGTNQGLFRLESDSLPKWRRIEGITSQTWDLLSLDEGLLVANNMGVYEVRNGQARLVHDTEVTAYQLEASDHYPGRVYIGLISGVSAIRRTSGGWQEEAAMPEVRDEVRTVHEDGDRVLWLGTRSSGILKVALPKDGDLGAAYLSERFDTEHGLPDTLLNYGVELGGELLFSTRDGLHYLDAASNRFVPYKKFDGAFGNVPERIWPLVTGPDGAIWTQTEREGGQPEAGALVPVDETNHEWDSRALASLRGITNYAVHVDDTGVVWLGGPDGLFRYDPRKRESPGQSFNVLIRDMHDGEGNSLLVSAEGAQVPELTYDRNRIRFEYAATSYDGMEENRFQVRLDGQDSGWGSWSAEPYIDYANLWEGDYRFRVRARNQYGVVSDEAHLAFRVLPPWYRTSWAYLAYVIVLVSAWWSIGQWRLRRMEAQKRALKALVRQRTRQLEEATVTDQLTGLRNRRYLDNHLELDISKSVRDYQSWIQSGLVNERPESDLLFFMIDIDHFKQINDTYGHMAGDRILKSFSSVIKDAFRDSDMLVRMGGEEFLAIARFTTRDSASTLAERLCEGVRHREFAADEHTGLHLSCSVGFACFPFVQRDPKAVSWQDVVEIADHCLYAAKMSGRDGWVGAHAASDGIDEQLLEQVRHCPAILGEDSRFEVVSSFSGGGRIRWQGAS